MPETRNIPIEKTSYSRLNEVDFDHLEFGRVFSDHMLEVDFRDGQWQEPQIRPFQNLSLSPSCMVFHYGQEIFEGFKAHRGPKDEVLLFRPMDHWERMNQSARRMCMPEIPENIFREGIMQLVDLDSQWVSSKPGYSLYIRPFMVATDHYIGVKPSETYKFIVFTCPVAGYYSGMVNVKVEEYYVRSAEGGTGFAKCGGNYGGSLLPTKKAQEEGYQQIIWTDAKEHRYLEECGTMNIMFKINGTLITPELSSSILPGITRKSVIDLARSWGITVEERKISIDEVLDAHGKGTLEDAFGIGTAATITPISEIAYQDKHIPLPPQEKRQLSRKLNDTLIDIKLGKEEDPFGWTIKVK